VLAYEQAACRQAGNPGYDVISMNANGQARYIEVKGLDRPWRAAGVTVTARQFHFALEHGPRLSFVGFSCTAPYSKSAAW
jgi:hypothetical protein